MEVLFLTIALFSIAFVAMGIGVIFGDKKTIKGSCGGVASNGSCNTCGGTPSKCENKKEKPVTNHYSQLHDIIQEGQNKF